MLLMNSIPSDLGIRKWCDNRTKIYRIIKGEGASNVSGALPGARETLTGFWSTNPVSIKNIINAHRERAYETQGGGGDLWPDELLVLETYLDLVKTREPGKHKVSHNEDFDNGEIFVVRVNDKDVVKRYWKEWLYSEYPLVPDPLPIEHFTCKKRKMAYGVVRKTYHDEYPWVREYFEYYTEEPDEPYFRVGIPLAENVGEFIELIEKNRIVFYEPLNRILTKDDKPYEINKGLPSFKRMRDLIEAHNIYHFNQVHCAWNDMVVCAELFIADMACLIERARELICVMEFGIDSWSLEELLNTQKEYYDRYGEDIPIEITIKGQKKRKK